MSRQRTVKNVFIRSFLKVLSFSLLATLFTWGLLAGVINYLFQQDIIRPANYYEKQIPAIEQYVNSTGDHLLRQEAQAELEQHIPSRGMSYTVISTTGEYLYGDSKISGQFETGQGLASPDAISPHWVGNSIVQPIPILTSNGDSAGTLLLEYSLKVSSAGDSSLAPWINIGILCIFLTPFLYVALFTYLIGRRISRIISRPLQQLLDGAQRIKERDLHFSIGESCPIAEVNQLTLAFEDMRRELALSLEREWKQEQERRTMFAALAHDLRTPLTIIQGHVEGLEEMKRGRTDDSFTQYLGVIKRNTANAAHLLKDMNTIAELENMSFHLQPIPMDVQEFMEDKAMEYRALCADKNITFMTDYCDQPPSVQPAVAVFDPYRISQVLDNLVANSVRHTPASGTITWKVETDEHQITMTVADTGAGFGSDELAQVFERFYQGRARSARQKGHAGLGLYIAKLLIRHHGGQISAMNHPEGGAVVRFSIPVQSDAAASAAGVATST